ncbi:MAG TPA: hypothetical protein VFQ53_08075 [Kofleriaceae bacterium]|nr:hypothetical protein [Kofleriaceae bacterium]
MKVRVRRRVRRPPDLTSLFDVLFIVVFVALIRAASAQHAVAALTAPPPPKPPRPTPPPPPQPVAALQARALASISAELRDRTPLVIRISDTGQIEALEAGGTKLALDVPLLEQDPDPSVRIKYLGDRSAELRLCRIAAVHLGVPDLTGYLVIIAPSRNRADLQHALSDGLDRDLARCLVEQRGIATLVEPEPAASPAAPPR